LDDNGLLVLLRRLIKHRDLVLLRRCEGGEGGASDSTGKQRRLVRDIETRTRRRLSHAGQQYKLVADVDLRKLPSRDSFEVVRHDEALQILDALARQAGAGGSELFQLLSKARASLTRDWRPPLEPDGLILLRRIAVVQAHAKDEKQAITPSQLKNLLTKIEIELVDMEGGPVGGEAWEVVLPDGSKRSGQLDGKGYALIDNIPAGNCQVTFPRLDEEAWSRCA
jgi:hypothetical protein